MSQMELWRASGHEKLYKSVSRTRVQPANPRFKFHVDGHYTFLYACACAIYE